MEYVILDLEWNGSYSKSHSKYINEIIEFGAVKVDSSLKIIDEFSMLIKPQVGKKISGIVQELTHISETELFSADNTFNHVLSKFIKFLGNATLLTWGTADILTLLENNQYYNKKNTLPFLKTYMDLQYYCEKMLNAYDPAKQMGLMTAAEVLNINFEESQLHRALQDSILSYKCFVKLYDKSFIAKCTDITNDEFFQKITFKTIPITDINNPLVDKKQMSFCCNSCKNPAKRVSRWEVKNKGFRAVFYCGKCKRKFKGRIQYKLKYEGISVNKSVLPYDETGGTDV